MRHFHYKAISGIYVVNFSIKQIHIRTLSLSSFVLSRGTRVKRPWLSLLSNQKNSTSSHVTLSPSGCHLAITLPGTARVLPLCQRFRYFRSKVKWKGPFRFIPQRWSVDPAAPIFAVPFLTNLHVGNSENVVPFFLGYSLLSLTDRSGIMERTLGHDIEQNWKCFRWMSRKLNEPGLIWCYNFRVLWQLQPSY